MNLSNQKLALTGFAIAAACAILGRYGISNALVRERDPLMIFAGGFVAGLSVVRFVAQWRTSDPPEPSAPPCDPSLPTTPPARTKS